MMSTFVDARCFLRSVLGNHRTADGTPALDAPAAPRDAVRSAPTAPADPSNKGGKKGNVEYQWKVEEGSK